MTILYKLTDQNYRTDNGPQWGKGIEHTALGEGRIFRSGWLQAYTHSLLAVLLTPTHEKISAPVLWIAEGDVGIDDGLRVGCTRLRTLEIVQFPEITLEQRVHFGILCALKVYFEPSFVSWAQKWLSGENRWEEAAGAVAWAAKAAVWADADVAVAAIYAAVFAAWAAEEAARGEYAAAPRVAYAAAVAAEEAVKDAAESGKTIDLIALAEKATSAGDGEK